MELDSLKYVWKTIDRPSQLRNEAYWRELTGKRFEGPVSKMKRNLLMELVLMIVLYLPVMAWYLFGFNGRLPEPAVFLGAAAVFFGVYYFRKQKMLSRLECPACDVKANLTQQLAALESYTRFYFYGSVIAVPVFLFLFVILLYTKLPPTHSIFYSRPGLPSGIVVLLWAIIFLAFSGLAFYANRWYVKKQYGKHIRQLKTLLQEIEEE